MSTKIDRWINGDKEPTVRKVTVSPPSATELLRRNSRNRTLKERKAAQLAAMMNRGEWEDAVADVNFDRDGCLINGQHTLFACVKSNTPIVVTLKTGLAPSSQDAVDTHTTRSLGDQLAIEGFQHPKLIASTARIVLPWRTNGLILRSGNRDTIGPSNAKWDRRQELRFCRENRDELEHYAKIASSRYKRVGKVLTETFLCSFDLIFTDVVPEHGAAFWAQFAGEEDQIAQPIRHYRQRLTELKGSATDWTMEHKKAYAIKALNAFMARDEIHKFQLRPNEKVDFVVPEGVN